MEKNEMGEMIDPYQQIASELFKKEYFLRDDGASSERKSTSLEDQTSKHCADAVIEGTSEFPAAVDFMQLKTTLNDVKSELSDKDMSDWHNHTGWTNPAGCFIKDVRKHCHPELCTQAFCKFYEILIRCPELLPLEGDFRSLHLCEAPGAFISALNHFIVLRRRSLEWIWQATTLNPFCEANDPQWTVGDDRLIFYTLDRWLFGPDNSGNLLRLTEKDISAMKQGDGFHLVTADGSIDCQDDPAEQERITFPLQFCETVVALSTLRPNGCFILKKFTTCEPFSVSLIAFLMDHFSSVRFLKPASSKAGNSEIYVVCCGFLGISSNELALLHADYGTERCFDTLQKPSLSVVQQIFECSKYFIDRQLRVMKFNLATYRNCAPNLRAAIEAVKEGTSQQFLEIIRLRSISAKRRLIPRRLMPIPWMAMSQLGRREGAFIDGFKQLSSTCVLAEHEKRLARIDGRLIVENFAWQLTNFDVDCFSTAGRCTVFGRPPRPLLQSKLCSAELLKLALRQLEASGR
uniref:Cap-specific mRNA (nucleoside-2'-O-)-methyltransferase 2 n=1 Tax=Plectus sambesii TaxID=2011161 RepID=A0A914X5B9_9BILA